MPLTALPEPLLDYLAHRTACEYLSDLRFLDGPGRRRVARLLKDIAPEAADLYVWNDALLYLVQARPEQTAEDARARLIAALSD